MSPTNTQCKKMDGADDSSAPFLLLEVPMDIELRALSLHARLAIALTCLERICVKKRLIENDEVQKYLDYMWEYIGLSRADFDDWCERQAILVDYGLGYDLPLDVKNLLDERGIELPIFHQLLENTTEILYGSMYTKSDDEGSLLQLQRVMQLSREFEVAIPDFEIYRFSQFRDAHGYGRALTAEELHFWRSKV